MLDKAVAKINELMALDMGPLVEDKTSRVRERVRVLLFASVVLAEPKIA